MKSVLTLKLAGNKLRLKSFNILKYLLLNNESFFLSGSNFEELKLKL